MRHLSSGFLWKIKAAFALVLLAVPAAAKTVEVKLARTGRTVEPAEQARAGDSIRIVVDDKKLTFYFRPIGALRNLVLEDADCKSAEAAELHATSKNDAALIYAVCEGGKPIRLGIVVLGPRRKAFYLAYSLSGVAASPIHLEPIGDPPVLTAEDEPVLVIVNKDSDHTCRPPEDFDLAFTVKAGTFIDVAPVRPVVTQPGLKKLPSPCDISAPPYIDYVLPFHKKFPGEQIVDYEISGYFQAESSHKVTETTDSQSSTDSTAKAQPPKDTAASAASQPSMDGPAPKIETVTEKDTGSHKIYGGELPQAHSLYYYNISTGVVATFLRDPTFTRVITSLKNGDANPAKYTTEQRPGSDRAMPVLMFSAYLKPLDAQVPWHPVDLLPAPTLGFSLSSPANDFFFGLSHEVRRHVQLVYGYHLGKVTALPKTQGLDDPTSDAAPVTTTRFKGNFFVGATFNIDFIKGLFK
ncbi:MAG: hypothetical protein LAP87_26935 [Acidobacteriia bacterium]|nr:hypothetical protein [Terriglobia bacterium]